VSGEDEGQIIKLGKSQARTGRCSDDAGCEIDEQSDDQGLRGERECEGLWTRAIRVVGFAGEHGKQIRAGRSGSGCGHGAPLVLELALWR